MKYDFNRVIDRRGSDSEKWRLFPPDVLPLWVADMDFPSPEPVIRALYERIEHGIFGYSHGLSMEASAGREFRDLIVARMKALYQWEIHADDLVFLPGVVKGLNLACHTLAAPDGRVLVQTPVYAPVISAPHTADQTVQIAELTHHPDGFYSVDLDAFEHTMTSQTRLFILCNPHNPVGRVFTRDELQGMAEVCLRKDVAICSDEIHCDFIFPGQRHIPIAALDPEVAQRTITLMAPSKTYNLAGLQFSIAIIPNRQLRKQFLHSQKGLVNSVNLMGMTAARAAYQEGAEWLEQLLAYLTANRDFVCQYIRHELPGITIYQPEGTFLAWLDCRELILDDPFGFFLEKAKVALNDGKWFGPSGAGFVRLNFGCPRFTLEAALKRMKEALISHNRIA